MRSLRTCLVKFCKKVSRQRRKPRAMEASLLGPLAKGDPVPTLLACREIGL